MRCLIHRILFSAGFAFHGTRLLSIHPSEKEKAGDPICTLSRARVYFVFPRTVRRDFCPSTAAFFVWTR